MLERLLFLDVHLVGESASAVGRSRSIDRRADGEALRWVGSRAFCGFSAIEVT